MRPLTQWVDQLLDTGEKELFWKVSRAAERALLEKALRVSHGNQSQACKRLGISRRTMDQSMPAWTCGKKSARKGARNSSSTGIVALVSPVMLQRASAAASRFSG